MKLPIIITTEAEEDLRQTISWHDDVRLGLGAKFERCFEDALASIQLFPEAYPEVYKGARRVLLQPFKYHVYYVIWNERIYIGALIHASRHPKVWKKRMRGIQ